LDKLEIIEIAYRRLTARRRVIWLRIGLRVSMFGVEIRNSLNFLRVFFSTFRYYGCSGRYVLLLQFFNVSMGIVSFKDKVVDLFLEEFNDCVALSDYGITFIDLILSMKNSLLPCCDNLLLLHDQGLKLHYLGDLPISIPVMTLSYTS
jgi:hypothetical protein